MAPIRLGIIVPSSNTALEPLTHAILSTLPPSTVTVHFSRFAVTTISLAPSSTSQFDISSSSSPSTKSPILEAAILLSHAKVDVIGWSGTSAGWLGFDQDEKLCEAITAATGGIPATTSVLALNKLLKAFEIERLGLLTPYTSDVQNLIIKNYAGIGIHINQDWERHLEVTENVEIVEIGEDVLDREFAIVHWGLVEGGWRVGVIQAVTTFCTNLKAAQMAAEWELKYDRLPGGGRLLVLELFRLKQQARCF